MSQLLLAVLSEILFESAASQRRAFTREMDRYFKQRGLSPSTSPRKSRKQ